MNSVNFCRDEKFTNTTSFPYLFTQDERKNCNQERPHEKGDEQRITHILSNAYKDTSHSIQPTRTLSNKQRYHNQEMLL